MIKLGPQIVKGGWCRIHAVEDRPDLCAKVPAPLRRFKDGYPDPDEIVRAKYGIDDFLEYEWRNYQKIMDVCPTDLRPYFVDMRGPETASDGRKALVMAIVVDDRGETAENLVKNQRELSPVFWNTLDRIRREVFLAHSIDHFGIVRRNILVRSPEHPVIIDFQTGKERYRGQFWLRLPWFVRRKVNRSFRKLYQEMGVSPERI
jgi:RIO kinase 1